jgi:hypothetical protein
MPAGFVPEEYPRLQVPVAPPGKYKARLSVAGQQYERPFEIRKDPRLTVSDEDLRAQFELMQQIGSRTAEISEAVDRLRSFRQQLSGSSSPETTKTLEQLHEIELALTRLPSPAMPDKIPPKALNNRLAALSGAVQETDGRPTHQMYAVFAELSRLTDLQLQALNAEIQQVTSGQSSPGKAP